MERVSNPYKPGTSSHLVVSLYLSGMTNAMIASRINKSEGYVRVVLSQWRHRDAYLSYQRDKYPLRSLPSEPFNPYGE